MRRSLSRNLAFAVLVTGVVLASSAHAQNFAAVTWVPIAAITEQADGAVREIDIVGSAAQPAASVGSDATYLYFRLRLNGKPTNADDTTYKSAQWGCLIDTNGVATTYEFAALVAGPTNLVHWRQNAVTATANVPSEPAEVGIGTFAVATHARTIDAASNPLFSADTDYFLELAIPWATIRFGAAPVVTGTPMRFVCGTGPDPAGGFHIGTDQAASAAQPSPLDVSWSQYYICNNPGLTGTAGCVEDDGDGVPAAHENLAGVGTNASNPDHDGDTITDNFELSAGAGPYGPFNNPPPDTDGDGVIDAKDTDSDNDCVRDSVEGVAGFRNAAVPNANVHMNCTDRTPFCRRIGDPGGTATGTCVACTNDNGVAGNAPCPFAASPICQLSGFPIGRCTTCTPAKTALCTTLLPACENTSGECAKCNNNNGTLGSAVCPTAALPACNGAGPLDGTCTECKAGLEGKCVNPKPACDLTTGACAGCNGDVGGGSTRPCNTAAAPYCTLTGGTMGQCAKCTSNADCGTGHTGPTCNLVSGACVDIDTDKDGLNDSVEKAFGLDFQKADTDGDGINDLVEVTPLGGGFPMKVDTDGDGMIDALDLDSDNDGVLDKDEGVMDIDNDSNPNFRDTDDDGDNISTKDEIADTAAAMVGDDVDGDGLKNWYDNDADGDGIPDGAETRADSDQDRIPNYLDKGSAPGLPDGGGVIPPTGEDAGLPPPFAADEGVLEGTGLLCSSSRTPGKSAPSLAMASLLAIAVSAVRRRRRTIASKNT